MLDINVTSGPPTDVRELATLTQLHFAAFESSTFYNTLYRNVSKADYIDRVEYFIKGFKDGIEGAEFIVRATQGENVVGYAAFRRVFREESGEEKNEGVPRRPFPEGINLEMANVLEESSIKTTTGPHLSLRVIAVDPVAQRQGIASAILDWACRFADENRLDFYLEAASREAIPLYRKFGFRPFGLDISFDPTLGGNGTNIDNSNTDMVSLHPMIRLPDPPAPLTISLARPSNTSARRLAELHRLSFSPYPMHRNLFGKVPRKIMDDAMEKRFSGVLAKGMLEEGKGGDIILVAKRGELILGFGYYEFSPPSTGSLPSAPAPPPTFFPEGANLPLASQFFAALSSHAKEVEHLEKEGSWHLHILVVDPAFQGEGVGKALLGWGIERAGKEGRRLWLDSTDEGRPVYDKAGFVVEGVPIVGDDSLFSVQPMVWRGSPK